MENLSEFNRVLCIFKSPRKAMEDIARKPGYALPITCLIIVPLLSIIVNLPYYRDQLAYTTMNAMNASGTGVTLTAEALEAATQVQLYFTLAAAPVMTLLSWLVFSLAVNLASKPFGGNEDVGFKIMLSVTGYAFLTRIVMYVFTALNIFIAPDSLLTFSLHDLAKLFTAIESTFVTSLLQQFSIFTLWEFAVVAIGLQSVKRISAGKSAAVMAIVFALQSAFVITSTVLASAMTVTM